MRQYSWSGLPLAAPNVGVKALNYVGCEGPSPQIDFRGTLVGVKPREERLDTQVMLLLISSIPFYNSP
jgi:hypothetical protein